MELFLENCELKPDPHEKGFAVRVIEGRIMLLETIEHWKFLKYKDIEAILGTMQIIVDLIFINGESYELREKEITDFGRLQVSKTNLACYTADSIKNNMATGLLEEPIKQSGYRYWGTFKV